MTGTFGFERDHYGIGIARRERLLLLALREAGSDTLIIADWFSCREQIAQTTGRTGAAVLLGAGLIIVGATWELSRRR